MVRTIAIALTLLVARTASAGLFCSGEAGGDAEMKLIEAFAKDPAQRDPADEAYAWLCAEGDAPRLRPRIERACRKILDRDGDASPCVTLAAAAGLATLGDHDVFTLITKLREDPIDSDGGVGLTPTGLLMHMGDPRGAAVIVARWQASIPRAAQRERRHREMASWSGWRQRAALALGALGGADDATFLDEQAKATKDRHVAAACTDAAAAIRKRLTP